MVTHGLKISGCNRKNEGWLLIEMQIYGLQVNYMYMYTVSGCMKEVAALYKCKSMDLSTSGLTYVQCITRWLYYSDHYIYVLRFPLHIDVHIQ